ncbi:hypothetical protein F4776DRAFT_661639 [Hypoxylon sp. NC0597]|nr:hypothetical protein F4776DRAFT_661639 [Hypoxylon sp. NC0597]
MSSYTSYVDAYGNQHYVPNDNNTANTGGYTLPWFYGFTNPYTQQQTVPMPQTHGYYSKYRRMASSQSRTRSTNSLTGHPNSLTPLNNTYTPMPYPILAQPVPTPQTHMVTPLSAEMAIQPQPNFEGLSEWSAPQHHEEITPINLGYFLPDTVPGMNRLHSRNVSNDHFETNLPNTNVSTAMTTLAGGPMLNPFNDVDELIDLPADLQLSHSQGSVEEEPRDLWGMPDEALPDLGLTPEPNMNCGLTMPPTSTTICGLTMPPTPAPTDDSSAVSEVNEAVTQPPKPNMVCGLTMPSILPTLTLEEPVTSTALPVLQPSAATVPTLANRPKKSSGKGKKRKSSSLDTEVQAESSTAAPQKKRRIVRADSCDECRSQKVRCEPHHGSPKCIRCYSKGLPCKVSLIDKRTNRTKYNELSDAIRANHGLVREFLATLYLLNPDTDETDEGKEARRLYEKGKTPSLIMETARKRAAELVEVPYVKELQKFGKAYEKLEELRKAVVQVNEAGLRLLGPLIYACSMAYHKMLSSAMIQQILQYAKYGDISSTLTMLPQEATQGTEQYVELLYGGELKPLKETLEDIPRYTFY